MDKKILNDKNILLKLPSENKFDAIERAGRLLTDNGYVQAEYIEGMKKREHNITTYIGNGIAIPHGTLEYVDYIHKSGISVVQYPDGVDFGEGNTAYVVIGIAGLNNEHLDILSSIAIVCQDIQNVDKLRYAASKEEIIQILSEGDA